jgi:hypothetical protein
MWANPNTKEVTHSKPAFTLNKAPVQAQFCPECEDETKLIVEEYND